MHRHKKKLVLRYYFYTLLIVLFVCALVNILSQSIITVTVIPKGATVLLDNAPIKLNRQSTIKKIISVGEHKIDVQAEGYIGISTEIKAKRFLPSTFTYTLKPVSEAKVLGSGIFLDKASDSEVYHLGDEGKTLYKSTFSLDNKKLVESTRSVTAPILSGIEEIIWSPNKDLALFRKGNSINIFDFKKYDFIHQTETAWGKDIGSIAWSPDGEKIAYYYIPEQTLIFSNVGATEQTRILNLADYSIENPLLRWSPDGENLLIIPQSKNYDTNKIYLLSRYNLTIKTLTDSGDQVDAVFSPDSQKILYFSYSEDPAKNVNSIISVMDKDGENKKALDIRVNPAKSAWIDSTSLIISAPDMLSQEKLFFFNTDTKTIDGNSFSNISKGEITLLKTLVSGKIILYQSGGQIYYLNLDS